jgi:hypothetical protein
MNDLINQLFSLRELSAGGEGVDFRFARNLPAWGWAFALLACGLIGAWSYWNLLGRRSARTSLGVLRTLLLALVVALIAGPELVRQNERVEQDWVVVMADRSASMTVTDAPGPGGRIAREEQLTNAIREGWPHFSRLAAERNVLFLGFDGTVFDLRMITDEGSASRRISGVDLGRASGRKTAIGQSLDQALKRVSARAVAGVVLFSDGRSSDTPGRAVLRQYESRQIPIFTVPLGSATPLADVAVGRIDAPTGAFVGDLVPVTVEVERRGGEEGPIAGRIQLVDDATGVVMDSRRLDDPTIEGTDATKRITMSAKPEVPGQGTWSVRLALDSPDLSTENNQGVIRIELVDRPIRVVYFDGYPRWEYRFVKDLLVREDSVRSSVLQLAAEKRYIQEGTDPLDALPRTAASWAPFDVIIMGDLRPGLFSDEQLAQIRDQVARRGAGLMWIGGSAATPGAWRGTPLGDLLPFTLSEDSRGTDTWTDSVLLKPGPAASRYGVLQLGESPQTPWPEVLNDASLQWPLLRWAQRISTGAIKPTAEVLAVASPTDGSAFSPLVMTMRYGAGRVVYVGTDETWRYRYGRGQVLPERFWIPLMRLLARESLGRAGKAATLRVSPDRAQTGQQVQVSVQLIDQSFAERRPESIAVRVDSPDGAGATLTLKPETGLAEDSPVGAFTATWVTGEPGIYTIEPSDPLLAGLELSARLEVVLPEDELRVPQTDHALLASLSEATDGRVLQASELAELPTLLPNRQVRLLGTPDVETLWDKPIVWILLMLLLTAEWVGRRVIKLS